MDERTIIVIIISALSIAAIITYLIVRKMNLLKLNSVKLEEIGIIPDYSCPKCNKQMVKGFTCTNGIVWRNESDPPFSLHIRRSQALENTTPVLTVCENMAWYCSRCRYVLIDHSAVVKVS